MSKRYTPKSRKFRPTPVPRQPQSHRAEFAKPVVGGGRRWIGIAAWVFLFLLWLGLIIGYFMQRFF